MFQIEIAGTEYDWKGKQGSALLFHMIDSPYANSAISELYSVYLFYALVGVAGVLLLNMMFYALRLCGCECGKKAGKK